MRSPEEYTVVSGVGIVSPYASNRPETIRRIMAGESAIKPINYKSDKKRLHVQAAAYIGDNFEGDIDATTLLSDVMDERDIRWYDSSALYGLIATNEALKQAQLREGKTWIASVDLDRFAVMPGTGAGGARNFIKNEDQLAKGYAVRPPDAMKMLNDQVASSISMNFNMRGEIEVVTAACTTSAASIKNGDRLLKSGDADYVVVGGMEAQVFATSLGSFASLTALDQRPAGEAGKSLHVDRQGFVEGAAGVIMIVENISSAAARGVKPQARLLGYASTGDAYHRTLASGEGTLRALRLAWERMPEEFQNEGNIYIYAHATGTRDGDPIEMNAINEFMKDKMERSVGLSAPKELTGHWMGAAAAGQAAFAIHTLQTGEVTPNPSLNPDTIIEEAQRYDIPQAPTTRKADIVIVNSAGFGGINNVLIFGRAE